MATEVFRLGKDAKVYRNLNTPSAPTWSEIDIVREVTLTLESGEFDASRRGSGGWRQTARTLKDASVEIEILHKPGDAGYIALRNAYLIGNGVELAIMDGSIAVSGNEGLRAEMDVFTFTRSEPLEEGLTVSVTVKPRPSANPPIWVVVP